LTGFFRIYRLKRKKCQIAGTKITPLQIISPSFFASETPDFAVPTSPVNFIRFRTKRGNGYFVSVIGAGNLRK
jgi:hypothetical protein